MAFFPCDYCGKRYRGPSQHLYPARVDGVAATRSHLRLDPEHMAMLLHALEPYLVPSEPEDVQAGSKPVHCEGCGQHMQQVEDQVFVTAFPRSQDRLDFWFMMHRDCRLPPELEKLSI